MFCSGACQECTPHFSQAFPCFRGLKNGAGRVNRRRILTPNLFKRFAGRSHPDPSCPHVNSQRTGLSDRTFETFHRLRPTSLTMLGSLS